MPFDPTIPANNSELKSVEMRNQFNGLDSKITDQKTRIDAAKAALDWSNGAPKLPDYTTIATPVLGNIAFNYSSGMLMVFDGGDWQQLQP